MRILIMSPKIPLIPQPMTVPLQRLRSPHHFRNHTSRIVLLPRSCLCRRKLLRQRFGLNINRLLLRFPRSQRIELGRLHAIIRATTILLPLSLPRRTHIPPLLQRPLQAKRASLFPLVIADREAVVVFLLR